LESDGLMTVRTASFAVGLFVLYTDCLVIFILGIETVRVTVLCLP